MRPINIFRAAAFAIILSKRITKIYQENTMLIKISCLRTFTNYYESIDSELKSWLFGSIRGPYLSILNFDDLRLDMTDSVSYFTSDTDIRDKYIKLEVIILNSRYD